MIRQYIRYFVKQTLKPKSDNFLLGQLTTFTLFIFIIDDKGQNTWEMTKILNFKMHRNKFRLLLNCVGDQFDWQFFAKIIKTPHALGQYYRKYFIRPGNDVLQQFEINQLNDFKNFAKFSYKKWVTVTVRIQTSTQLLIKFID